MIGKNRDSLKHKHMNKKKRRMALFKF